MEHVKPALSGTVRNRTGSAVILLVAAVACVAYAAGTASRGPDGPDRTAAGSGTDLSALEQAIARGDAAPDTWLAYGDALAARARHDYAAQAYRKVLETQPFRQEAQFRLGLSLANAGNRAALKSYLQDLALNDAKLAVDLFERPELRSYLDSEAFRSVFAEARSQAND